MTSKLDSKEKGDKDVTSGYCLDARHNKLACGHLRPHSPLTRKSRTRRIDSSNIVAVLDRFGHEIDYAAAESDCSDAKTCDISAQLSVREAAEIQTDAAPIRRFVIVA